MICSATCVKDAQAGKLSHTPINALTLQRHVFERVGMQKMKPCMYVNTHAFSQLKCFIKFFE